MANKIKSTGSKDCVKMAFGGAAKGSKKVAPKGYAAGGAAKERRGFPMTKPVAKKK